MTESNQSQENQAAASPEFAHVINAKHDNKVDVKDISFTFRKQKDEATGMEKKRPNVELKLLTPSVEGIVHILEQGGKPQELLLEVIAQRIFDEARETLNGDESLTAENFPYEQVLWDAIANQPESERKGRGIPKEIWEDFAKAYLEIMPAASGKTEDNIKKQAALILLKFAPLKHHEKKDVILPNFQNMLTIFANTHKDAEQYAAPIEFLLKKIDQMLNADKESNIEDALGF